MKAVTLLTAAVLLAGAAWADGMMTDGKDKPAGAMSSGMTTKAKTVKHDTAMTSGAMPTAVVKKGKATKHSQAMQGGAMHSGAMSSGAMGDPKPDASH